jgi:hypothetical protein
MMGSRNGPYQEDFPVGSEVRIRDASVLEAFQREWRFHHTLTDDQLQHAGCRATVKGISFYHGADELYELQGIPGIWHEGCLEAM